METDHVVRRALPAFKGLEADAGLPRLHFAALCPLAPSTTADRAVKSHLEEGRFPFGVKEVDVPVIGHRGPAVPGDVVVV